MRKKKIDKRACRKVAQEPVWIHPNNALLYIPSIEYVLRAVVRNISGKRMLVIYMIPVAAAREGNTTPKYVVFQGKDDFVTLEYCENGKTKWRTTRTKWLDNISQSLEKACAFLSKNDTVKVIRFCGPARKTVFDSLSDLQWKIRTAQEEHRRTARKKQIAALMRPVNRRHLPKRLLPWVEWNVFPAHIFYQYRKGKRYMEGYCTRCKTDVMVEKPRHKEKGVCPNCHAEVTFHAAGRSKRIYEQETVQVLQHIGNDLVVRLCKATVSFGDYKNPQIQLWEAARMFFSVSGDKYSEEEYYFSSAFEDITPWKKGPRPEFCRWIYYFAADKCGHIYPCNLTTALKGTPWQYSQLKEFYQYFKTNMTVSPYLYAYYKRPALEYLIKLGLFRLAQNGIYGEEAPHTYHRSAFNWNGKNLREVLGVDKAYLPVLQELNANSHILYLLQQMISKSMPVNTELLLWCQEHRIYQEDELERCLQHSTPYKLMKYLNEQAEKHPRPGYNSTAVKTVFDRYQDYIRFCNDLGYDLTDDFILYPRDVKDAHDRASEMFDKKKAQIYNEKIAAQYAELVSQYQMFEGGLMVIPPKSAEEIVEEGQKLHHCVGGYVSRVAKNECTILFLRKEEQPDTPFYTMEVQEGKVKQLRGDGNCDPTPVVKAYLELWKKEKLLPAAKQAA